MRFTPPTEPAAQLQWLVDRAVIGDLLLLFARAIDENDHATYVATFADDGVLVLPHVRAEGREAIRNMPPPRTEWRTQHISTNHQIRIEGDRATARAYLQAAHVFDPHRPTDNARAGGWYDTELRRASSGWLFTSVRLHVVWETGAMIPLDR